MILFGNRILLSSLTIGLLLNLSGCDENAFKLTTQAGNEELVIADIGPIHILTVDSNLSAICQETGNLFGVKAFIDADKGGQLKIGSDLFGTSRIIFDKGSLPADTTVSFEWREICSDDVIKYDFEFGPDSLQFDKPCRVEISYQIADLALTSEQSLKLFYYNRTTETWEFVGGEIDAENKRLIVYLEHFSRYAVAWGE